MLLLILFICHLLGDFFLQTSKMADDKKEKFKELLIHSIVYGAVFLTVMGIFLKPMYALLPFTTITITHFIVDLIRTKIDKRYNKSTVRFFTFLIDQLIHLGIISAVYSVFDLNSNISKLYGIIVQFSVFKDIVLYTLLFSIILSPTSVLIKKIFQVVCKDEKLQSITNEMNSSDNISPGSLIGMLERVITAILLLCNQFGAIGLVLTAKSIARFKKMEDETFAEKYLIGTLLSLSITLVVTLVINLVISTV